jgi:hypothetical protein
VTAAQDQQNMMDQLGIVVGVVGRGLAAAGAGTQGGQLAWRQHDGGHTDAPNMKYFIQWADKWMGRTTQGQ